jgi:hypothetical protein
MTRSVFLASYSVLTECLIQARTEARLTQWDLAYALERPQSFVSKVENGERRIDLIEFLQITTALNAEPEPIIRAVLASLAINKA